MAEALPADLRLHIGPLPTTGLRIERGDYDIELDKEGCHATLWLGRHMIAVWFAGGGESTPSVGPLE